VRELDVMSMTPPGYVIRPPRRDDAVDVAKVITACRGTETGDAETTPQEVIDDWHGIDLATDAMAVLGQDGHLAGYVDIANRGYVVVTVYGYVWPEDRNRGIGRFLVAWGEGWLQERVSEAPDGSRVVIQHFIDGTNRRGQDLLAASGYEVVRRTYEMTIVLDAPLERPTHPPGISARTFRPGRDDMACHGAIEDAFRDVWGRPASSFERFEEMTEWETFDPSLWFLAWDGDDLAGVALGRLLGGEGWTDVVGVRRGWRGRGLALALLREAFGAYRGRGVRRVGLSVDAESATGAPRLYARAGMAVARTHLLYRKEVRPGFDPTGSDSPPG
jgi:ribosomal protein S18 acetylase RimI-like enzyme